MCWLWAGPVSTHRWRSEPSAVLSAARFLQATARVVAVQDDLVKIEALQDTQGRPADLVKNEVIYILPADVDDLGEQERLKAEVLRVYRNTADAQVYESTAGVAVDDPVEQSGEMLSVSLGPGLLGRVYDGLQTPLYDLASRYGVPAYLESSIKGVYERAGVLKTNDGSTGSLTIIGTVSPAGGNFDEPVTQATLSTVKDFLGLSSERAYKRFYPAVDPLLSWSRCSTQLETWFDKNVETGWTKRVREMRELLSLGESVSQMMQVTGEEGISPEDFVTYQKSLFLDIVFLQQDSFDPVDSAAPLERQKMMFTRIYDLVKTRDYRFKNREEARDYFTKLTGLVKNFNYARPDAPNYASLLKQIDALADSVTAYASTKTESTKDVTS